MGLLAVLSWPAWPQAPRSLAQLMAEARQATPPTPLRSRFQPDLVEVVALDPSLKLDISYATKDNFLGTPIYGQARAFLQRPVAEALVRANHRLQAAGYAIRIRDAYRPWWVTKVFWEATPPANRAFVANPDNGSVHNRGCAVDVDLVDLTTGLVASMPSGYDEMSPRAGADYAGGEADARRHRDLLRAAMEAESFKVLKEEWWHFDHVSSEGYPVLNLPFEAIQDRRAELASCGQILRVTTAAWDHAQGHLQRFERQGDTFVPVGRPLLVWVGKGGFGWRTDQGAPMAPAPGPLKHEGDLKAPAGMFTFGDMWGYAPKPPEGVRLAYHQATPCDWCVDDPEHPDYGRLKRLPANPPPSDWKSSERLLMETEHYRYMVVISYNMQKPIKGAGSCIFFHVSPAPGGGTAGCTALSAEDLLTVLRWMDPAKHPLLLQMPVQALDAAVVAWHLPEALGLDR